MKKWILLGSLLACLLISPSAKSQELGFLFGGGVNIEDFYDNLGLGIYFSTDSSLAYDSRWNFFIPFTWNFKVDEPNEGYLIGATPSVEYNVSLSGRQIYFSPMFGLMFAYGNQETAGITYESFVFGLVPTAQFKFIMNRRVVFRVAPFSMLLSPFQRTNNGVGFTVNWKISYQAWAGVSLLF